MSMLLPAIWNEQTARLVSLMGEDTFFDGVLDAIHTVIPYNQIVIICMRKDYIPSFWGERVEERKKKAVMDQYVNGGYLLDPWFHAKEKGMKSGAYFPEDVMPDDFYRSEYYLKYYKYIEVENEAIIAVNLDDQVQIQISMGIMEKKITETTRRRLQGIAPFIIEVSKKHWMNLQYTSNLADQSEHVIHERISQVFQTFGNDSLSERERDVALLIIRGYSLKAVSDMLGIAFGTTKVHCKNLYKKLDINSQSELFGIFIDQISANRPECIE